MRSIRCINRQEFAPFPGVARITVLGTRFFVDQGVALFASATSGESYSEFRGVPEIAKNRIASNRAKWSAHPKTDQNCVMDRGGFGIMKRSQAKDVACAIQL